MDLDDLKQQCLRAVDVLMRDHGYAKKEFVPADGTETLYAPHGLDACHVHNGFIEPGVHRGTPLHWYRCSHEYDEWECRLPTDLLADIECWAAITDDEARALPET